MRKIMITLLVLVYIFIMGCSEMTDEEGIPIPTVAEIYNNIKEMENMVDGQIVNIGDNVIQIGCWWD